MREYTTRAVKTAVEEQSAAALLATRDRSGLTSQVLNLQRAIGNRAVGRLLQANMSSGALRTGILQRDDKTPDPRDGTDTNPAHKDALTSPGGPIDTGDRSLQCGWVNGQFQCGIDVGKGDPLQVSGDALPGSGRPATGIPGSKVKDTCPADRYAWGMDQCCGDGKHVSENGANCVRDAPSELPPLPAAVPEQKGDFESVPPGSDEAYG